MARKRGQRGENSSHNKTGLKVINKKDQKEENVVAEPTAVG